MKKIYWVCTACGFKHGSPITIVSTFHKGGCDICKKIGYVTQGRDYGIYEFPTRKRGKNYFSKIENKS